MTRNPFVLDEAEDGRVLAFCIEACQRNRFISRNDLRAAALAEFGVQVRVNGVLHWMPGPNCFGTSIKRWRAQGLIPPVEGAAR